MVKQRRKSNGQFSGNCDRFRALEELVTNATTTRSRFIQQLMDPRRSINDECGYPDVITLEDYRQMYVREGIATRVNDVRPNESWKVQPTVFETEDPEQVTSFEKDWKEVSTSLRGTSWYQDEEGNPVWEHLQRADVLSGIGAFGVMLIGLNDGKDLDVPVTSKEGMRITFLRSFDESLVTIQATEKDIKSPRFGQPVMYTIDFDEERNISRLLLPSSVTSNSKNVHWSRVLHVAETSGSSEILATPRQQPVFNRLMDLRKLYGGSAEMYWRGAFPGYSLETHPELGGDVQIDEAAMKDKMEQFINTLQRYMFTAGMSVKSLAVQVVDPAPQIDVQITAIAIKLGIPKRVLMGSERGELASGQDDKTWNDRVRTRQNNYITPRIIVTFIDRLIQLGVLAEPEGYSVIWPDLDTISATEQAQVALNRTDAMTKYVAGNVEAIMTPVDFLHRVVGFTEEEALAIIKKAMNTEEPITIPDEDDEMDRRLIEKEAGAEIDAKFQPKEQSSNEK